MLMKTKMRDERDSRGWTLNYVAERVGVSAAQVSRIESEGVKAAETARAIADLFGNLTLDQICAAEPAPAKKPVRAQQLQKAS